MALANHILATVPPTDFERLLPEMEAVSVPPRHVFYRAGERLRHVIFPGSGVVSLVAHLKKGGSCEVAMVGKEGMVGLAAFLGAETSSLSAVAQSPVEAVLLKVEALRARLLPGDALDGLLRTFAHRFLTQVSQTAACNSVHSVHHRCARWLMMLHSRIGSDHLPVTQEFLAQMLGVRRASVTEVAGLLQEAGWIRYRRGRITVLDRDGLESASCGCHRIEEPPGERGRTAPA